MFVPTTCAVDVAAKSLGTSCTAGLAEAAGRSVTSPKLLGLRVERAVQRIDRLAQALVVGVNVKVHRRRELRVPEDRLHEPRLDAPWKSAATTCVADIGGTARRAASGSDFWLVPLQQLLRPLTSGPELAGAAPRSSASRSFSRSDAGSRMPSIGASTARYNAARTIDTFADRLRGEVNLDALREGLLVSVQQTDGPAI